MKSLLSLPKWLKCSDAYVPPSVDSIPKTASLATYSFSPLDQGDFSDCGGCGTACGLYVAYAAAGKPLGWIPSQACIYAASRAFTRAKAADTVLPSLTDNGVFLGDTMTAASTVGIMPMLEAHTADGRLSDVDVTTVDKELTISELEACGRFIPPKPQALDVKDPNFAKNIAACINAKHPVVAGIVVDTAFESWRGGLPITTVNLSDPQAGGHCVCFLSYETDANGKLLFWLQNSWGAMAGVNGFFAVGEDFLANGCYEAYAVVV